MEQFQLEEFRSIFAEAARKPAPAARLKINHELFIIVAPKNGFHKAIAGIVTLDLCGVFSRAELQPHASPQVFTQQANNPGSKTSLGAESANGDRV